MKGFKLLDGDVVVSGNDIKIIGGNDLTIQTVKQVVSTNNGEWAMNEKEGINFSCLRAKKPNYDEIRDNILSALLQVDETFEITDFEHSIEDRKLTINFTAKKSSDETINVIL